MKFNKAIALLVLVSGLGACSLEELPEQLTAPVPQVPVPNNLSALLGDGKVTLSWDSQAGYTYSGFVVYRNEVGAAPGRLATPMASPYVDTSVRTGVSYEYRIAGITGDGIEGSASSALLVRSTVFSAAINAGAAYTNSRSVALNLGAPPATQLVRFSENPAFTSVPWITFVTPVPFQLTAGDGTKTVYLQFTDEFGHPTESISASIILDTGTAIQSASFTPATPAAPGAQLHFTVTPVGTELEGQAEILLQGLTTTIVAMDDGTGGDTTPNNGIYEANFVVPQSLRGVNLSVTSFFNDAAGNRSVAFELPSKLTISDPPQQAVTLLPAQSATTSSIALRWSQATGANFNRYEIYRDTSAGVTTSDLRVAAITDIAVTVFNDTSLDEGVTHYYRVFVANDLNEVVGSNEISATTVDDPPTPVVVDPVSSVTQTSLTLTWSQNANTDFAEYRVYRGTQPGVTDVPGLLISTVTDRFTNFFDDSGLNTTLNTYYYRVYVVDQAGNRARSNEVSAVDVQTSIQSASFSPTTPSAPGATVHFKVTPGGNELGGSAQIGITGFTGAIVALDTGISGDPIAGDGVYETDFVVPPSLRGSNLTVTAIFTDAAGNQSSAFEMASLLSITDPPTAVTLFTPLNVTTSSMMLRWSPSSDPNFLRYEVYRSTSAGVSSASSPRIANIIDPAVTQFNDTGLNEGATYFYKVYIVNDLQQGTPSNEISAATADEPPTAVVLDPVSSVTQTSLALTWNQNANTDFKEYRVYRRTSPGVTDLNGTEVAVISSRFTNFFDDSGINTSQNPYYYRVYVVDQVGNRTRSNEVSALVAQTTIQSASMTPITAVQPGQVVHFRITPGGNRFGGSARITIAGFAGTITALDDGTGGDPPPGGNGIYEADFAVPPSLRGTGLAVTAVFTTSTGFQTAPFELPNSLSITNPPMAVTLSPGQDSTTTSIGLLWSQSPDAHFARYEVYRGQTPGVSKTTSLRITTITDRTTNFFTDTGLAENKAYYYIVYVGNDLDEFAASNVRMLRTADVPPTPVVLDPITSITPTGLTLNWSRNDDTDFKEYRVYRSTSPGVTDASTPVATIMDRFHTFFDDFGLNTGTTIYYYKVYVVDQSNKSSRSNEVSSGP